MNSSPSHRLTHPDPDLLVDRTLHALNHVQPTPGLENRLLAALEDHRLTQTAPRRATLPPKFLSIATATVVLALTAALSFHLHRPHSPSTLNTSHLAPQPQPTPKPAPDAPTASPTTPGAPSSPTVSSSAKVGSLPPIHLEATLHAAPQPTPPHQNTLDEQALADFHAPSQLAPPMPPTDQERLIGLMLRHGEKHDLASLDLQSEAALARQEHARFQTFFDPPPSEYLRQQIEATEKLHPSRVPQPLDPPSSGDQK